MSFPLNRLLRTEAFVYFQRLIVKIRAIYRRGDMMITPLDKYNWITTFLGKYLTMCGSNFTDGNFNIPWRGQIYLGFMVMGISATIYTVLTAEVGFAMQAVVFLCIAVQVNYVILYIFIYIFQ